MTLLISSGGDISHECIHTHTRMHTKVLRGAGFGPQPAARSPQPAARSPQPAVRSPQPAARSPQPAARSPQSAGCVLRAADPVGRFFICAVRGALRARPVCCGTGCGPNDIVAGRMRAQLFQPAHKSHIVCAC